MRAQEQIRAVGRKLSQKCFVRGAPNAIVQKVNAAMKKFFALGFFVLDFFALSFFAVGFFAFGFFAFGFFVADFFAIAFTRIHLPLRTTHLFPSFPFFLHPSFSLRAQ
jgi:hypothetical protein